MNSIFKNTTINIGGVVEKILNDQIIILNQ